LGLRLHRDMPDFTFVLGRADQPPELTDGEVEDINLREDAIAYGRALLERAPADVASVAIGCGTGDAIEWLGAWDRGEAGSFTWSPDD
jgi:hypothetical protein